MMRRLMSAIALLLGIWIGFSASSGAAPRLVMAAPAGAVCYTKSDGSPSAYDLIDTRHSGAIGLEIWKAYYATRYQALPAERRAKTSQERYLKYAAARFKGLDKDRSGSVTCAEYKASLEKMKMARLAKAAAAATAAKPAVAAPRPRVR